MVTPIEPPTSSPSIVVGVDGSERSKAALAWAGRYASLSGEPLTVLIAWQVPVSYGWPLPLPEGWDPVAEARGVLEREVKEVLGEYRGELRTSVIEGPPERALVEASESALLVVVGSRGHGEFVGMLLGSVSEFLTTHARCPVVVVRDGSEGKMAT
jgi:nucleotide-binding universal stress UspA family protein